MYFCAAGLVLLLPFVFLFCQALTFALYEGAWRWRCLLPLPVAVAPLSILYWFQTPVAFVLVMIAAPTAGVVGLAFVWALYSRSAAASADAGSDPADEAA